jgi:hypothetical protein
MTFILTSGSCFQVYCDWNSIYHKTKQILKNIMYLPCVNELFNPEDKGKLSFSQFVPVQAINAHAGVEVQLHSFLTSALDEDVWSTSRSIRFDPQRKSPPYGGHQSWSGEKCCLARSQVAIHTVCLCQSIPRYFSEYRKLYSYYREASHLAE